MKRLSLRTRIAATVALTSIALIAIVSLILYQASESLELQLAHQIISEELTTLQRDPEHQAVRAAGVHPAVYHYIVRSKDSEQALPRFLRSLSPGYYELADESGHEFHVGVRGSGATRFIVTYDIGEHEDREANYKALVVVLAILATVSAIVLGRASATRLTRRLRDLASRVAVSGTADREQFQAEEQEHEVAALAAALDGYRARIAATLERERAFNADVGHELRTPLAAIRSSAELLSLDSQPASGARAHAETIVHLADHMEASIRALLFLARGQTPIDDEPVALEECVSDALVPFLPAIRRKSIELDNRVPADHVVTASRQGLQLILANLLANAIDYTDGGRIEVALNAEKDLVITDSGKGIAPDILERIFERGYRGQAGGGGLGLGLDIVRRICERLDWSVSVCSQPGSGTQVTLHFHRRALRPFGPAPERAEAFDRREGGSGLLDVPRSV